MYVPAKVPLQVGDVLRLDSGSAQPAGQDKQPVLASVVRLDRHALLTMGHVAVGLKFNQGTYASDPKKQTPNRNQV